jgi:hypothetical protein
MIQFMNSSDKLIMWSERLDVIERSHKGKNKQSF